MEKSGGPRRGGGETPGGEGRKTVRSFTATQQDLAMLAAIARYHGFSKSGTITSLVRREFWRIFPAGTEAIRPDRGARVMGRQNEG